MTLTEKVNEVIKSGISPITFQFEPVVFFQGNTRVLRSFLVINSLDLGVLNHKQYRFVARRTKQGDHLVHRHIEKLLRAFPQLSAEYGGLDAVTIPVYARLLRDGVLAKMLMEGFALFPRVKPEQICVELSADILYEDLDEARARIDELRDIGVKVAINEVGDEFCPVFRLSKIMFDYAFMDSYTTDSLGRDDAEQIAGSMVNYLHYLGVKTVAPVLDSKEKVFAAKALNCDGYTLDPNVAGEEVKPNE
ncbi:MAG: EAL domain-containing protein [Clostridia bacterium]|nr:EAL domain-containing protein [Clostridia bacterium]